ncbi:MAG: hypothetical protein HRU32_08700 [Rhodobacteraceae bacterium]|nr:hypothetical protein [Paracoccaceae bacterium]
MYSSQPDTDLKEGGSFSVDRAFLRIGGLYRGNGGTTVGLAASRGQLDYAFGGTSPAPFTRIENTAFSVPVGFQLGSARAFVAPSLRYSIEGGASMEDGRTYGAFGGVTWRVNDSLSIGPGLGVFSQIESSDLNVFPALLIDWDITDRWNLSTAQAPGATEGPGLTLTYRAADKFSVGVAGRLERYRFRLNGDGLAPGGVGEDESFPLVATFSYQPFPGSFISAFVGAEFNGRLSLEDANGALVDRREYDTAPIAGAAFRLAF